jgi:adenosylmethionine-8-amino-7-oxononanoate aminotransferase
LRRNLHAGKPQSGGFSLNTFSDDEIRALHYATLEVGKVAGMISKKCLKNGLLIYPGSGEVDGQRGVHILVAPPFVIQKDGIDKIVSILGQSIAEVEAEVL